MTKIHVIQLLQMLASKWIVQQYIYIYIFGDLIKSFTQTLQKYQVDPIRAEPKPNRLVLS
jgi:hypothetical protein